MQPAWRVDQDALVAGYRRDSRQNTHQGNRDRNLLGIDQVLRS
jgi:hypothetical protein